MVANQLDKEYWIKNSELIQKSHYESIDLYNKESDTFETNLLSFVSLFFPLSSVFLSSEVFQQKISTLDRYLVSVMILTFTFSLFILCIDKIACRTYWNKRSKDTFVALKEIEDIRLKYIKQQNAADSSKEVKELFGRIYNEDNNGPETYWWIIASVCIAVGTFCFTMLMFQTYVFY